MRESGSFGKRATLAVLLVAIFLCPSSGVADPGSAEYAVKVAMIYNFARFTEWPSDAFSDEDEPLRLVVYGDQDLADAFAGLNGKRVAGHKIQVERTDEPGQTADCHLLFLARTERDDWPLVRAALAHAPVLTIGEMNGFLESGGVMNLHLVKNKIRFQVNLTNMRSQDMKISSRILKLASEIIDEGKTEH